MCTLLYVQCLDVCFGGKSSAKGVDQVSELSHTCVRTRATATSSGREQTEEDKGVCVCVCVCAAQCNYAIEGMCDCRNCHVDSGQ